MRIKNMDFSKFQEVTPAVDKLESQKFIFEETKIKVSLENFRR